MSTGIWTCRCAKIFISSLIKIWQLWQQLTCKVMVSESLPITRTSHWSFSLLNSSSPLTIKIPCVCLITLGAGPGQWKEGIDESRGEDPLYTRIGHGLTQVEVKTKDVFVRAERLAVGEANDESEWLSATQNGRFGLSVHQLVTDGPVLGRIVLCVEVDLVDGQRRLLWFGDRRDYKTSNLMILEI